ncbi:hypothetical protein [Sulfitobacter sp.]|uniref:hypothetical protein n=1 Tax=Sulfitobacter sp. TaxID=1903071 RepID=UPI003001C3D9
MAKIKIPDSIGSGLIQEQKYEGIGECIYCRANDVQLTDEHILPRGMNGYIVMKKASCIPCAREIQKFEGPVMQKQFGMVRQHLKYRSKKKSTYTAPIELTYRNGMKRRVQVGLEDYPLSIAFQSHKRGPTYLEGADYQTVVKQGLVTLLSEKDMRKILDRVAKKYGAVKVGTPMEFNLEMLSKLTCKIGHGMAVATYGLDNFQPITVDYILGKEIVFPGYYVGGSGGKNSSSKKFDNFIMLQIGKHNGKHAVFAHIGLFSTLGFPIYTAIVGNLKIWNDEIARQTGASHTLSTDPENEDAMTLEKYVATDKS